MSHYSDNWGQNTLPSAMVASEERWAKVVWRNEAGKGFRAIIKVKPNPIGFHARLPGDKVTRGA